MIRLSTDMARVAEVDRGNCAMKRESRELKHLTFSTGRRQPEVQFTSDPRFPPTGSAVTTLRRLCFGYFDVAFKT